MIQYNIVAYACLKRLDQNHMTRYLIATNSSVDLSFQISLFSLQASALQTWRLLPRGSWSSNLLASLCLLLRPQSESNAPRPSLMKTSTPTLCPTLSPVTSFRACSRHRSNKSIWKLLNRRTKHGLQAPRRS